MTPEEQAPFLRILCPVEIESQATKAIALARRLAIVSGGCVYLLHVAHIPHEDMDVPLPIGLNPRWEQETRAELERLGNELLRGVRHEIVVHSGIAPMEILRAASDLQADVIVMATHARTGLSHLLLGSVTERVIREAPCPVMTIHPH